MKITRTSWLRTVLYSCTFVATTYSVASTTDGNQQIVNKQPSTIAVQQTSDWQQWRKVGEAQLSILFFDIYQSKLLSPTGIYQQQSLDVTPHPLALSIEYQRNITQAQLLDATYEQWIKLGYREQDAKRWIKQLSVIFPDIKSGQKLTYVTDGVAGKFVFSPLPHQTRHIGTISDEKLNDAFLSIWLSPKTEYAQLRRQLIG